MARVNVKHNPSNLRTHEGAPARHIGKEQQLIRSVMACMLWESSFYESGESIAERIKRLVHDNSPQFVADLAIKARSEMNLRHVPLLLVRELARHKQRKEISVADTIEAVIQRADELTEFLAIYWKDGKESISSQVKKGLAQAFIKFDAYNLAKYNRDNDIKLRDVLFLAHPKPKDSKQEETWRALVEKKLAPPDTWEVALSAGKDKKATWIRLMEEDKLGGLALLRNLRNMSSVNVPMDNIKTALSKMKTDRVLPFRFITASRYAPSLEPNLEEAMLKGLSQEDKITGKTVLLVDVSRSMEDMISSQSDMSRFDAACGLAILLREICDDVRIFAFSHRTVEVPARNGFALRDAIINSMPHNSTQLGEAVRYLNENIDYERLIVITDEQSRDSVQNPKAKGYMINVSSEENGVGYGKWVNITGFSESVIRYIRSFEIIRGWDE